MPHCAVWIQLIALCAMLFFSACSSPSYKYRYVAGKTGALRDGYASAPPRAPSEVHAAVAAANRIAGLPYRYGGGHGSGIDTGYDCSGAASYVLAATGRLRGSTTSKGFRRFGKSGEGRWISIYARKDHVFLVIAGLRFDTGYTRGAKGPQWTTRDRPARGSVVRHPAGL